MADLNLGSLQHELRETLAQGGCPLCRLVARDEQRFLDSLTYERILDIPTREALQQARGLCPSHARAWREVQGCALSIALVYRGAVKSLLAETETLPARTLFARARGPRQLAETLAPRGPCPACSVGEGTVKRYAEVLLQELRFPEVQAALTRAGGLCLPHLRLALATSGPAQSHTALLAAQREAWTALLAQLDEFIRKNDYRFQHEPLGDERDSWLRALDALTGSAPK